MESSTFKEAIDNRRFLEAEDMIKGGDDLLKSQFQFKLSDAFPKIIQNNAYHVLQALVEHGHIEMDIFEYDSFQNTLFEALARHAEPTPEAIEFLNDFIPEVENLNDSLEDTTWLGLALISGTHPDLVQAMIDNGCELNYLNNKDETLYFELLNSSYHKLLNGDRRAELFHLLVKAGLDINRPNKFGDTVLHVAIRNQRKELITALLENGADPNQANQKGDTAYSICILDYNDRRLCEEMMELYPLDLHAERGKEKTLLYEWLKRLYAPTLGENEKYFLQTMAEHGADPNAENMDDYGNKETVWDVVVSKSFAFFEDFLDVFEADVNQQDNNGNTLLHKVCGYDVNFDQNKAKDTYRKTKKLLKMGADASLRNTEDKTAADLAGQDNLKEKTVTILLKQ